MVVVGHKRIAACHFKYQSVEYTVGSGTSEKRRASYLFGGCLSWKSIMDRNIGKYRSLLSELRSKEGAESIIVSFALANTFHLWSLVEKR